MACGVRGTTLAMRGALTPFGHLQQRHRSEDDAHLLNTAAQQLLQLLLVFLCDFDMQGRTSHTLSMRQNISDWNCFIRTFSGGQRTRSESERPMMFFR
jgi:hypothetical protein